MQNHRNTPYGFSECPPPLLFDNAPGGTQESYLAPSQPYPNNQSCNLFFEESVNHRGNGTGQSHPMQMAPPNSQMIGMDPWQFQLFCDNSGNAAHNFQMATQAQLNQWVACRQSNGPPAGPPEGHGQIPASPANHPGQPAAQPQRSPSSAPATGMPPAQPPNKHRAIIPPPEPASPRVLHLDYAVYIRSVSNELARAHSKRLAPASKDWKKSVPKGGIIWKTGMTGWTGHSFKEALIQKLDEFRQHEHFGKHLTTLDKDDDLKWKCIVTHHRVYGVKSHAFVSNKAEFEEFAEAVLSSPSSKCTEKNEAKELALTYGDKEERASLEKTKTRLACNPKADVTSGKAILMKAAGVDFQNPPDTEDFPSEPIKVWTRDERTAENAKSHAAHAKSNGPKNTPPGTRKTSKPKASTGYSPDEEEPKRKYTPSRNPDRPKATAPTTKGSAANTSLATGIDSPKGRNKKYPVEFSDDKLSTTGSESNLPPRRAPNSAFNCPDEADNADSSDVEVPHAKASLGVHRSPARKAARSPAGEGVHDEFGRLTFGKNHQSSPLPIRKRPNSQLSSSIASIPPPKSQLSPRSSMAPSSHVNSSLPSDELPKAPLTKDRRKLTLDDFLTQCYFACDDVQARGPLVLNCIGHWDFFCTTTIKELMGLRYPFPQAIAQRMVNRARALEYTHVQHGYSYSFEV
ncbi:hypothetical protein PCANC_10515 [Puccinia coronata f. sp. avenae]|uniref:Uncharacterized protein n=1 Tax=Puccinia coronata f. sp. avenae TaxID=200324 RepID=A0A2N5VZ71_9BASI|nr:hypothetical protein PCANC_10515 [Puccinia coronata f. sp. avenae]